MANTSYDTTTTNPSTDNPSNTLLSSYRLIDTISQTSSSTTATTTAQTSNTAETEDTHDETQPITYKGRLALTVEYVALTSTPKKHRFRLHNEIRALAALQHPNVLAFHKWYETTNHIWTITEYCAGGNLATLLEQDGALPEVTVLSFGLDVLAALQHIHSRNFLLVDLRPSGILLNESGLLKVADFGLSRHITEAPHTDATELVGALDERSSPSYIAPELIDGSGCFSHASDFWAFGCLLYEMALGAPPFADGDERARAEAVVRMRLPRSSQLSFHLDDLLRALLQKSPSARPTWEVLRSHAFWAVRIAPPDYPIAEWQHPARAAEADTDKGMRDVGTPDEPTTARAPRRRREPPQLSPHPGADFGKDAPAEDDGVHGVAGVNGNPSITARQGSAAREHDALVAGGVPLAPPNPSDEDCAKAHAALAPALAQLNTSRNLVVSAARAQAAEETARAEPTVAAALSRCIDSAAELAHDAGEISVRPIVGNRAIERQQPSPACEVRALPFRYASAPELLAYDVSQLESLFRAVHQSVGSGATLGERTNMLLYVEELAADSRVAGLLAASAVGPLLVAQLRAATTSAMRLRLATALGLVLRNAPALPARLARGDLTAVLAEAIHDGERTRNSRLRRNATAALGEALFYISVQQQSAWRRHHHGGGAIDGAAEWLEPWSPIPTSLAALHDSLASDADLTLVHYAAKGCENILATTPRLDYTDGVAAALADTRTLALLLSAAGRAATHDATRACAVAAAAHLLRLRPHLAPEHLLAGGQLRPLAALVRDGSARASAAAMACLVAALRDEAMRDALRDGGSGDGSLRAALLRAVVAAVRGAQPLLRARGCLAVALLCSLGPSWLLHARELFSLVADLYGTPAREEGDAAAAAAEGGSKAELSSFAASCARVAVESLTALLPRLVVVAAEECGRALGEAALLALRQAAAHEVFASSMAGELLCTCLTSVLFALAPSEAGGGEAGGGEERSTRSVLATLELAEVILIAPATDAVRGGTANGCSAAAALTRCPELALAPAGLVAALCPIFSSRDEAAAARALAIAPELLEAMLRLDPAAAADAVPPLLNTVMLPHLGGLLLPAASPRLAAAAVSLLGRLAPAAPQLAKTLDRMALTLPLRAHLSAGIAPAPLLRALAEMPARWLELGLAPVLVDQISSAAQDARAVDDLTQLLDTAYLVLYFVLRVVRPPTDGPREGAGGGEAALARRTMLSASAPLLRCTSTLTSLIDSPTPLLVERSAHVLVLVARLYAPSAPQAVVAAFFSGGAAECILRALRRADAESREVAQCLLKALRCLELADNLGFRAALASSPPLQDVFDGAKSYDTGRYL